jgi:hemoglobin
VNTDATPAIDIAAIERRTDLDDRAAIEALLRRFYDRVLTDDVLAEPFRDIREKGLESHLPVMCDFWETVLFGAKLYRDSVFHAHRPVHQQTPLSTRHFQRWLTLWNATVDEMYHGPTADRAKLQAGRIAFAMQRRFSGDRGPAAPGALADFIDRATAQQPH